MENKNSHKSDMQIDFVQIFKSILLDKINILIYCIGGGIVGLIIAFSVPNLYRTSVMLAPEATNNSLSTSMSSIASMVGMDMKSMNSEDAISPEFYPDLMNSMDFLTSLFDIKVTSLDGKIKTTYSDYICKYQAVAWWNYPSRWIQNIFNNKSKRNELEISKVNAFKLSKEQYNIALGIKGSISCKVDKKTDIITIEVQAQDPLISATMADSVMTRLQTFITNYRTNKARNDLAYTQKIFEQAKNQYEKSRQLYGSYSDANQELILASYKMKQEDLENEMQLKYNIYTQVAQQLQMAKAKVQERTPAFTVIQSASVPLQKSNVPKSVVLFFSIFIGFVLRVSIILMRNSTFKEQRND